jgi:hypothetical protein
VCPTHPSRLIRRRLPTEPRRRWASDRRRGDRAGSDFGQDDP